MISGKSETYICPLCQREHTPENMTWHHLLPKNGNLERDEPRIYLCKTCHTVIHFCHTNDELRNIYNTLDKILQSNKIIDMINIYKYDCKPNKVYKIKNLKHLQKCA